VQILHLTEKKRKQRLKQSTTSTSQNDPINEALQQENRTHMQERQQLEQKIGNEQKSTKMNENVSISVPPIMEKDIKLIANDDIAVSRTIHYCGVLVQGMPDTLKNRLFIHMTGLQYMPRQPKYKFLQQKTSKVYFKAFTTPVDEAFSTIQADLDTFKKDHFNPEFNITIFKVLSKVNNIEELNRFLRN